MKVAESNPKLHYNDDIALAIETYLGWDFDIYERIAALDAYREAAKRVTG